MKCKNVQFRHELLLSEDYIRQTLVLSLVGYTDFGEMKRKKEDIPGEGIIMSKQLVSMRWREMAEVRQGKAPAREELESHAEAVELMKRIIGNIRWCFVWFSGKQVVIEE